MSRACHRALVSPAQGIGMKAGYTGLVYCANHHAGPRRQTHDGCSLVRVHPAEKAQDSTPAMAYDNRGYTGDQRRWLAKAHLGGPGTLSPAPSNLQQTHGG